jgi:DNA-binding CsgD family transcriptional regulator
METPIKRGRKSARLSRSEQEVLVLIALGYSSADIARLWQRHVGTVHRLRWRALRRFKSVAKPTAA